LNDGLIGEWKEAVLTWLRYCMDGLRKTMKTLVITISVPGRS
jgi:hypothetical protein